VVDHSKVVKQNFKKTIVFDQLFKRRFSQSKIKFMLKRTHVAIIL